MKKFLIAAALMFAAIPAQAQLNEEICVTLGDYGGKVMELRKLGVSKERVLSLITTTDMSAYKLMLATVDFVYGMPVSVSATTIDELVTSKCLEVTYNDRYPANT